MTELALNSIKNFLVLKFFKLMINVSNSFSLGELITSEHFKQKKSLVVKFY